MRSVEIDGTAVAVKACVECPLKDCFRCMHPQRTGGREIYTAVVNDRVDHGCPLKRVESRGIQR